MGQEYTGSIENKGEFKRIKRIKENERVN